jgi:hypothetical protein
MANKAPLLKKYQSDAETTGTAAIFGILIKEEHVSAAGAEPGGNLPRHYALASVGVNKGGVGVRARHLVGRRQSGSGPLVVVIPILTKSVFDGIQDSSIRTIGSGQYKVTKVNERGRR